MFQFLHLSDLHMPTKKDGKVAGIKSYRRLENVIKSISELDIQPRFILITGDVSNDGTLEGYKLAKELFQRKELENIPVHYVMGNEDNRDNFFNVFGGKKFDTYHYSVDYEPFRVIVLDSYREGTRSGYFDGDQLEWLEELLHVEPVKPFIVAFHHTLFQYQPEFDVRSVHESHRIKLFSILQSCNVLAILNGHHHFNQSSLVDGFLNIMAGSTFGELSYNDKLFSIIDASSYNLVIYRDGRLFVKTIYVPSSGKVLSRHPIESIL